MATYSALSGIIYRQLSDEEGENYSEEIVYDAVCAGHDAILPWVPNYQEADLTAGSDGDLFQLPSNVYDIQSVQLLDDNGKFISRASLAAGTARGNTQAENDFTESPKGYLSLAYPLDEGDQIRLYYLAHWEKPASSGDSTFIIKAPAHAHMGIVFYALSVILTPVIVDTATLGPFKSKVDSGTPIHNPMKDVSNWCYERFIREMKVMPPYQKARA
jgi:hypothetical protein